MKTLLQFAALAGLVALSTGARAQTVLDTNVGPTADPPASGTFHVVISRTSPFDFAITVTGNNDGRVPGDPSGFAPKSGIGGVTLSFFADSARNNTVIANGAAPGSTTAYAAGPGVGTNVGPDGQTFGTTGGVWNAPVTGPSLQFSSTDLASYIAPHGGNTFASSFTLANPDASVGTIGLNGYGQSYSQDFSITPEASSIALLLPGIGPLAYALRRRIRRA